jgi:hypothetical protein
LRFVKRGIVPQSQQMLVRMGQQPNVGGWHHFCGA